MEKLDLMRVQDKSLVLAPAQLAVRKLRVWHCKFRSLVPIAQIENLEELVIAFYPDATLAPLAGLKNLRHLTILHLPLVRSLEPLSELRSLESLSLATSPTWDASGRVLEVASLKPLAAIPTLRHLELFGVCNPARSLAELEGCPALSSVRVSQYPRAEAERFYQATGLTDRFVPPSSFD